MASTYSPKLRFELIGAGEQAGLWGSTTNKNVGQLIEQAIAGVTTIELDGQTLPYTLTALDGAPDQSRSAVILCTYAAAPAAAPFNLIIPTQTKLYVIRNDCGQTITVKTSAQTGGVQLLNGEATLVFCDGTDAIVGLESAAAGTLPVSGGGTGVTTFGAGGFVKSPGGTGALTASATVNASSELSGTVPIARGGTGVSTVPSNGQLLIGNGTGYSVANITGGSGIAVANSAGGITISASGGSGITQITSGTGITVSSGTGPIATITNAGVTAVSAGSGISVSASTGSVSISSTVNPSDYVTTSGSQSVSGQKTFTSGVEATGGVYILSTYHNYNSSGTSTYWNGSDIRFDVASSNKFGIGSSRSYFDQADVQKIGGGTFNSYSDRRYKQDITDYNRGLAALAQLNPVNYRYTAEFMHSDQPSQLFVGLIAQDVQQTAFADCVTVDAQGYCVLDISQLTFALINAVQELNNKVTTLEAEVAALKGA